MKERITCRILTGPTAGGKSALGLRLAEEMGWVVACMDSMQIYRGMNIGTAKPTPAEQKRVKHYLLDICDPAEEFSVAAYRDQAEALVRKLWEEEGREVLFIGGTGLYMQALIHPMEMGSVAADPELRNELKRIAEQPDGRQTLHARLEALDPKTAARLPLNDIRRCIRAIEVSEITGIPFSQQTERALPGLFDWKIAAVRLPREQLYERINLRVTRMMNAGLEEEVKKLLDSGVPENAQSMSGIGYKEMIPCVRGECSMAEAAEQIRLNTRHYAKRQMTFLRRDQSIQYVRTDQNNAYDTIRKILCEEQI